MIILKILCFCWLFNFTCGKNYFCNFACGKQHTVCKREPCNVGPKCKNGKALPMDNQSKRWVVDAHNEMRNKVALGNDTRGGNGQSANMHVLSYDKELEFVAQCWANACAENGPHDVCRTTKVFKNVGQNMFFTGDTAATDFRQKKYIDEAVRQWYEEIKYTTTANIDKYHESGKAIGHFTQIMWAKTTHLGCARTQEFVDGMKSVYIYCNYGPGGNVLNFPVYERGKPCSNCQPEQCNSKYPGLCGTVSYESQLHWLPPFSTRSSGCKLQVSLYKTAALTVVFILM